VAAIYKMTIGFLLKQCTIHADRRLVKAKFSELTQLNVMIQIFIVTSWAERSCLTVRVIISHTGGLLRI